MAVLTIKIEGKGLPTLAETAKKLGNEAKAQRAFRRAINETLRDVKTPTKRALADQTGLNKGTAGRALKIQKAQTNNLSGQLKGQGGYVRLKYFKARETQQGVSAAPFGNRKIYPNTFIKGGRFPKRVDLSFGNQVFEVTSGRTRWGRDFTTKKSEVRIPDEMVKGQTAEAFESNSQGILWRKVREHILKVSNGTLK